MVSPLRVALFGWSLGFLAAGAWGLTQPANHRLATAMLVPAGIGTVLLLVLVLSDLVRNRGRHEWVDLEEVDGPEHIPVAHGMAAPAEAAAAGDVARAGAPTELEDAAAARIAALEVRLAAEQEELDELIHALAEADAAVLTPGGPASLTAEEMASAAELEPMLRQQVLDALVELVGDGDVLPELERLTAPGA
jgi:hypothetical protein